jgi:ClpP class serine protease
VCCVNKSVKPVYAFTDGTMASAAYWLGSSAGAVFVSQTAMTGSIGVIATHTEYSKALKEAGIGVTVMRAGEYKALANSMEPLSEVAKMQLQDQLNAAYGVFIGHVAEARGTSVAIADKTMGQGREFFGSAAVDAGLADGVRTFDGMMSMVHAKVIDSFTKKGNTPASYPRGVNMTRQALTEQQIAAMASGAPVAGVVPAAEPVVAPVVPAAEADPVVAPVAAVVEPKAEVDTSAALITYLQAQVKEKDTALLAQSVELTGLKSKLAGMEASHTGLMKIAAQSVSNMKVGLGLAKVDFSAMTPELLLAEHASTSETFKASFKVGGVAAVNPPEVKPVAAIVDHMHAARIAATRFPNTK